MSVDSDFLSAESDYKAENYSSDGERDADEEVDELFKNLTYFQHIYDNNAIIDKEVGQLMIISTDEKTKYPLN